MISVKRSFPIFLLLLLIGFSESISARSQELSNGTESTDPAAVKLASGGIGHDITVNKLLVHYVESGSGSPVILIHGNAGGVEDFQLGAIELLAASHRVIAIDRPGHGGSDRPTKVGASVEYQAQLLHDTLAQIGVEKPILVGHSWGGSVALSYALQYPDGVAGLILLAPAAYPDGRKYTLLKWAAKLPVVNNMAVWLGKSLMGRSILKKELERAFYPQKMPDKYFKLVRESWFGRKQLTAFMDDESILNDSLYKMRTSYFRIRVPVTIIMGDKDTIVVPKENAYRLKDVIRHARLVVLKNTGHEIPQTHPECILDAIALFKK